MSAPPPDPLWRRVLASLQRWALDTRPNPLQRIAHEAASWRFLAAFVAGVLVAGYLADLGVVRVATLSLDAQLIDRAARKARADTPPAESLNVSLATVSENDYPLEPDELRRALCAIHFQDPAVVVVDIDTSYSRYEGFEPPAAPAPVVWAQGLIEHWDEEGWVREQAPVFGLLDLALAMPEGHSTGIAGSPRELDRSIQRFPRFIDVGGAVGARPTLHFEAVRRYCGDKPESCADVPYEQEKPDPVRVPAFRRLYRFERLSVETLELLAEPDALDACAQAPGAITPTEDEPLYRGKIVVLGFWDSPYDRHATVFGDEPGMQIVASAIQHELHRTSVGALGRLETLGIDLLLSLSILAIHAFLRPAAATIVVVLGLGLVATVGAYWALATFGLQASVIPLLLGIHLEQLTSSAERAEAGPGPQKEE